MVSKLDFDDYLLLPRSSKALWVKIKKYYLQIKKLKKENY